MYEVSPFTVQYASLSLVDRFPLAAGLGTKKWSTVRIGREKKAVGFANRLRFYLEKNYVLENNCGAFAVLGRRDAEPTLKAGAEIGKAPITDFCADICEDQIGRA